jgi:MFS transporter, PAT family, beta-lactamase induction signal transducer AmpG
VGNAVDKKLSSQSNEESNEASGISRFLGPYADRRMLILLCLGISSGLPILLIGSTLSLWLKEVGVSLTAIGLFSWTLLPYKLKFLWAPIVDQVRIPWFPKHFSLRQGWLWSTQLALAISLWVMSSFDPQVSLYGTALMALVVAFFSATQDIVIDGYRVELLEADEQGAGAAVAVFGYRIGMIISGAGALYVAEFWSWQVSYKVMACCLVFGVIATYFAPDSQATYIRSIPQDESFFQRLLRGFIQPLRTLLSTRGSFCFLVFIMLYRVGDALANKMQSPFLLEMGFSKIEIANVAKSFGIIASIVGVMLGGFLVKRWGILKTLWIGGCLQMLSNFTWALQAYYGHDIYLLFAVESVYQITGGVGMTALAAYLSYLSHREYSATYYAILTAIAGLLNMTLSSISGFLAESMGWIAYFNVTALTAIPGLILLAIMLKYNMTGLDRVHHTETL